MPCARSRLSRDDPVDHRLDVGAVVADEHDDGAVRPADGLERVARAVGAGKVERRGRARRAGRWVSSGCTMEISRRVGRAGCVRILATSRFPFHGACRSPHRSRGVPCGRAAGARAQRGIGGRVRRLDPRADGEGGGAGRPRLPRDVLRTGTATARRCGGRTDRWCSRTRIPKPRWRSPTISPRSRRGCRAWSARCRRARRSPAPGARGPGARTRAALPSAPSRADAGGAGAGRRGGGARRRRHRLRLAGRVAVRVPRRSGRPRQSRAHPGRHTPARRARRILDLGGSRAGVVRRLGGRGRRRGAHRARLHAAGCAPARLCDGAGSGTGAGAARHPVAAACSCSPTSRTRRRTRSTRAWASAPGTDIYHFDFVDRT